MTKQDFIKKWIGWVSYTNREKLTNEMEVDLELVSQALRIHDVVGQSEQLKCHHQYMNAGTLQGDTMKKCLKCGDYVKAL